MSNFRQGRYSWAIKPISYTVDLSIIIFIGVYWFFNNVPWQEFTIIISSGWIITAFISKFYEVYRYSSVIRVFTLLVRQILFFSLFPGISKLTFFPNIICTHKKSTNFSSIVKFWKNNNFSIF